MSKSSTILEDPVCGMSVDSDDISADYQGTRYAFCSEQCRERFQENPKLYTDAEDSASEPDQLDIYEYRVLKLADTLPIIIADRLIADVREMMGIQYIEVYDNEIEISFDPKQATESQIEAAIALSGKIMGEEWAAILSHAFTDTSAGSTSRNQG